MEEIFDAKAFKEMGLDDQYLYLLVHSGSRAFGASILKDHTDKFGLRGLKEGSIEAKEYLQQHDHAVEWAKVNRQLIIHRFLSCLQGAGEGEDEESQTNPGSVVTDIVHNCVIPKEFLLEDQQASEEAVEQGATELKKQTLWLHRKGAAPSDVGPGGSLVFEKLTFPVVIPGSRGALSYIVIPTKDAVVQQFGGYSLAHGAGRCNVSKITPEFL